MIVFFYVNASWNGLYIDIQRLTEILAKNQLVGFLIRHVIPYFHGNLAQSRIEICDKPPGTQYKVFELEHVGPPPLGRHSAVYLHLIPKALHNRLFVGLSKVSSYSDTNKCLPGHSK